MRQHSAIIDQSIAEGGFDSGLTPLDSLFISLIRFLETKKHIIDKKHHLPIRKIEVFMDGEINTDAFMVKIIEGRIGSFGIRVHTKIDTDIIQEEKVAFLQNSDARCPISSNIHNLSSINFVVE